jgi:V/A-type H+-transporting ATPase subunit I
MIMGDGGYGMLMLLLLFWFRIKARGKKPAIKRFLNMGIILSLATVVYGVMSGSVFGLSPNAPLFGKIVGLQLFNGGCTTPQGAMDKAALTNMMRASILIGMIHISLSLLLKSFRLIARGSLFSPCRTMLDRVYLDILFWYGEPYWGVLSQHPLEIKT